MSNAKLLNLMMISRYYGPLVVMINKMWVQLLNAAVILFLIMLAYGAAVQVLLFPRSTEYNWELVFNIFYYPYFQLFGEMFFEYYNAIDKSLHRRKQWVKLDVSGFLGGSGHQRLCWLTPKPRSKHKVFSDLVDQSRNIWMENRFRIVFYFDRIGVLPAPFSTLHVLYSLLKRLVFACSRCCKKTPRASSELAETASATSRMSNQHSSNDPRLVWRRYGKYYTQIEYGMRAYLHRFQEYCGNAYYKTVEKDSANSFDTQMNSLMRR
ncbi:unnamed protein product [Dibothriocephalus latus]|uniref:Ion transport domain-containing protein n=1 Tax=Dibothriocephalus latus TaxID=60516 RepID=A0A3P7LLE8_DIBLA|nr:unnamed protein product [Dibothriocephalus latus]